AVPCGGERPPALNAGPRPAAAVPQPWGRAARNPPRRSPAPPRTSPARGPPTHTPTARRPPVRSTSACRPDPAPAPRARSRRRPPDAAAIQARRRRSSARTRPHRPDARRCARPGPAGTRSRSSPVAVGHRPPRQWARHGCAGSGRPPDAAPGPGRRYCGARNRPWREYPPWTGCLPARARRRVSGALVVSAIALPRLDLGLGRLPDVLGKRTPEVVALLELPVLVATHQPLVAVGCDQFALAALLGRHACVSWNL